MRKGGFGEMERQDPSVEGSVQDQHRSVQIDDWIILAETSENQVATSALMSPSRPNDQKCQCSSITRPNERVSVSKPTQLRNGGRFNKPPFYLSIFEGRLKDTRRSDLIQET
jgi:hypothetical protein